jgi:hypothetical protein
VRPVLPALALLLGLGPAWADPLSNLLHRVHAESGLSETVLRDAAALGLVRAADPGARWISPYEAAAWRAERAGGTVWHAAETSIVPSNRWFWVQGAAWTGQVAAVEGVVLADLPLAQAWETFSAGTNPVLSVQLADTSRVEVARAARPRPSLTAQTRVPGRDVLWWRLAGLFADAPRAWPADAPVLLLDLRGAGGDNLDAATALAAAWHEHRQPAARVRLGEEAPAIGEATEAPARPAQLILLTDTNTTGAAEALVLLLHHGERRVLRLGEPTAGDYALREPGPGLDENGALLLRRRYRWEREGKILDAPAGGLSPHLAVAPGPDAAETPRPIRPGNESEDAQARALNDFLRHDPVLRRAVDIAHATRILPQAH